MAGSRGEPVMSRPLTTGKLEHGAPRCALRSMSKSGLSSQIAPLCDYGPSRSRMIQLVCGSSCALFDVECGGDRVAGGAGARAAVHAGGAGDVGAGDLTLLLRPHSSASSVRSFGRTRSSTTVCCARAVDVVHVRLMSVFVCLCVCVCVCV